jgi:AraC-like DNA-binding protein
LVGDLWRAAVAKTGKGALGLHVAMQMQPGTLGLVEYAARNNATLGDALRTLARYSEVLAEGATFRLDVDGELARFTYAVTGSPQPPSVVDFVLGYVARIMREGIAPPVKLHEVVFNYPTPVDRAPYEALFKVRLRFDAKENAVVFDAAALNSLIETADPHLHAVLDQQARKLVAELPVTDAFEERVQRLMASELRSGDPTARGLAKKLRMSPRTFQRRLLDAGTTNTKLLDEVRHGLSLRLLDQNELTLGEISAALGYSDVSAFRKAFRRWTGHAPRRSGQQDD